MSLSNVNKSRYIIHSIFGLRTITGTCIYTVKNKSKEKPIVFLFFFSSMPWKVVNDAIFRQRIHLL